MKQNRTTIVKQYKVFDLPTATRIEQSRKTHGEKKKKSLMQQKYEQTIEIEQKTHRKLR